jgi:peptide/nickel transport system substrate-binding protein
MFVTMLILLSVVLAACSSTKTTTAIPAPTTSASAPTTSAAAPTTSKPAPTTSGAQPAPTTSTAPSTSTAPTTSAKPTVQPVYGGTLRLVSAASFPKVLGLPSEMAPADSIYALPVLERLVEWDAQGNLIPVLAEKWVADTKALTITWTLRKGVKFHDGTDFNAEAVRFNWQMGIDTKRLTDNQFIKSLEVLDPYTIKMNLTKYTSMMFENYGWAIMISPTAYQKSGATEDARKVWARSNGVGTGPFKSTNFVRDTSIRYEKNTNYWRPGMPYLDAMELRYIPDVMTAAATLEAKQCDMWVDASMVQTINDLEKKGMIANWGPGMFNALLPNSSDPASPMSKKLVREAVEYAIDRPALANMIGYGKYEALTQMAPAKFPGYVQGYNPRPYNPAKAKDLLAQAGFPNGFKTKIMTTATGTDPVSGIKAYLDAVGIKVDIDIADMGRYFGEVFGAGWKADMVWSASGINPDGTDLFVHYGPTPMTFKSPNIYKSPQYLALCEKALAAGTWPEAVEAIKQAVKQAGDDAMIVPVYRSVSNAVMQPYVHSDYYQIHGVIWTSYDDWMDKR